jgi:endogenous inhibitor of DNA gyrase (YacG/DUF329 family)
VATRPPITVECPRCRAPASLSAQNKWRPFCSERCKLIDLGDWAAERYRVAQTAKPSSEDEPPEA